MASGLQQFAYCFLLLKRMKSQAVEQRSERVGVGSPPVDRNGVG